MVKLYNVFFFLIYCGVNVDVIVNTWRQICWLKWNGVVGGRERIYVMGKVLIRSHSYIRKVVQTIFVFLFDSCSFIYLLFVVFVCNVLSSPNATKHLFLGLLKSWTPSYPDQYCHFFSNCTIFRIDKYNGYQSKITLICH